MNPGLDSAVLDAIGIPVLVVDRAGSVVRVNRAAGRLTGHHEGGGSGVPFSRFFAPGAFPAERERVERIFAGGEGETGPVEILTRSRERRQVTRTLSACASAAGTVDYVLWTADVPAASERSGPADAGRDFRRIADANLIGVIFFSLDGSVIDANDAFLNIIGYNRVDLDAGRVRWADLTPPESRPQDEFCIEQLRANGVCRPYEKKYIHRDGTLVPVIIAVARMELSTEEGIAFVIDISARQRTEEALRFSEARFRACFSNAAVPMALTSLTGRILEANAAYCRLLGYTERELQQMDYLSFTHPDDREGNIQSVGSLAAGEVDAAVFRKRYVHKDGTPVWVQASIAITRDARGRPAGYVALMENITERLRAEQALRSLNETLERRVEERTEAARLRAEELARSEEALVRQKHLLQLILDNQGDGVVVADENGDFVLFTAAAERIVGVRPDRIVAEAWPKHFGFFRSDGVTPFHGNDLPLRRALRGQSVDDAELFVRNAGRPNGAWIGVTARPIIDEAGRIRGAVSVVRDLDERKRAEAMLRESEQHFQQLAEHNRRLVRELEHRVRNNLSALLGLVTVMRDRAADMRTFADAIEGRLTAMAHVDKLLSRSGWQAVDLRTLVTSSLATMQYMAAQRVPEDVDGPPVQIPPALVLPLNFILVEWFTNSCKHGAHHASTGGLRVRWEIVAAPAGQTVRLTWRETGGPPVRNPVVASLGTELVRAFATRELGGRCELNFPEGGADHVLEFACTP